MVVGEVGAAAQVLQTFRLPRSSMPPQGPSSPRSGHPCPGHSRARSAPAGGQGSSPNCELARNLKRQRSDQPMRLYSGLVAQKEAAVESRIYYRRLTALFLVAQVAWMAVVAWIFAQAMGVI